MRYQIGDYVPLSMGLFGTDVTAKVFSADGALVETVELAGVPERNRTGRYVGRIKLDGSYSPGHHMIVYLWTDGALSLSHADQFEIVPNGRDTGAVISQYWMELPEANAVIFQMDGGQLCRQINPHLPSSAEV
jgi:hypothetical protein